MLIIGARRYFKTKLNCKAKYIWSTLYKFEELKFWYILVVFISFSSNSWEVLDGQKHLAFYQLMLLISEN